MRERFVVERAAQLFCVVLYYYLIFGLASPVPGPGEGLDLTFNSMLEHLLSGRSDVDPQIVGPEGFQVGDKVVAYWGIFCALLRLPLLLVPDGLRLDITQQSCFVASLLSFLINVRSVRYLERNRLGESSWLSLSLYATVALTGAQVCFLRPSLFQEVCLWAAVMGFWFVHWALRACVDPQEVRRALPRMALAAGVALLTRVSMGVGLYAALGLFMATILGRQFRRRALAQRFGTVEPGFPKGAYVLSIGLAAVAILAAGLVNFQRWGSPFTFADYSHYIMNSTYPDRLQRVATYGLFSLERIPLGFVYYFVPVWVFPATGGKLVLERQFERLIDVAELPPSSFFLTDGWLLLLSGLFVLWLWRQRSSNSVDVLAAAGLAIGLSLAAFLMLSAISMNYRYRIEFYPLFTFCGFMGAIALASASETRRSRWRRIAFPLVAINCCASFAVLALYWHSPWGPGHNYISPAGLLSRYLA